MALVVMAGASFSTVSAKGKKDKKAQNVEKTEQAELKTYADSLSFAAGMTLTDGLMPYLKNQFGLTDSQMADMTRGFKEAVEHRNDSVFRAKAAGIQIAEMVGSRMLPGLQREFEDGDSINTSLVYAGFIASLEKNYSIYTDSAAQKIFSDGRAALTYKRNEAVKEEGEAFLEANKQKEGVVTLDNGLQYKVLKEGTGAKPSADDEVEVIYEGRTIDGKVFDSTAKHGKKSDTFGVGGLIKGWTQALQMMPAGSKWELYIPQELAYGERGAGKDIKPYSALIFTIELVGIKDRKPEAVSEKTPETGEPKAAHAGNTQTAKRTTTSKKK